MNEHERHMIKWAKIFGYNIMPGQWENMWSKFILNDNLNCFNFRR